ncbi:hypothetical protein Tco_0662504 [Tanacetum coccineum]
MSDLEDSTVTYTAVSSPFEGLSDIGSLRVDGPPMMPKDPYAYVVAAFQALPFPDYVPVPEEPEHASLSPKFVPKPVYLEFMPPEDKVFPAEELPLSVAVSPTTDSPGYMANSDPEEDEEDPKEDPTDYPVDGGDDNDDDESSDDDEDDDDDDVEEDEDEEDEEEHPAPIPSPPLPVLPPLPVSPPALPASPTYPLGFRAAMIRQRAESPSTSHSLLLPPPIILSHTRAYVAMIRAAAPSTYILAPRSETPPLETPPSGTPPLLPIPLPTPSPPLILPLINHRANRRESSSAPTARPTGGFRADYGFVATLDDEITCNPKRYVGYGITDTWDDMVEDIQGTPAVTDVAGLSYSMSVAQTCNIEKSSEDYCIGTADEDCSIASSRPRSIGTACRDTETDEYTGDIENGTKKNHQSQPRRYHYHTFVTIAKLKAMINQGVTDALAARDAHRNTNGDDSHNLGTGVRRTERVDREYTYPDFMKCQPLNFKSTEGVVELIQWLEKMETMFSISNCFVENQIKFSTSTLLAGALTWWNSHVRTIGHDVAYAMTWC